MLRVHPTPKSETAENRLSESTQAPALFPEVSTRRAEGMGIGEGGRLGRLGGQLLDLSLRFLGVTSEGGSIDVTQFSGGKTYVYVVIARNILEVSKDIGYLNCEIGITVLILLQCKNYKVLIK